MIKDTITYRNNRILTIYHKGFFDDEHTLKRFIKEHIGKNLICFSEQYVQDDEWNNLTGFVREQSALIMPKEKFNPYHESACAEMIHRICNKPSVIWKKDGTNIAEDELVQIIKFIEKYTGMDLTEYPVFLGDIFLFSPSKFKYHTNEANAIIVCKLQAGMKIVLRLKNGHNILDSKIIDIIEDTEELEVPVKCDWNNHDIEIYKNEKLIYINQDIYYMRSLQLNFSVQGRNKIIPLTKLQEYYEQKSQEYEKKYIIGMSQDSIMKSLNEVNKELVQELYKQKSSDGFMFIQPGELEIAMKKIADIIFDAKDELWLIDSYFTDKRDLNGMNDWLRLIIKSKVIKKNIVFCCKDEAKALNHVQLRDFINSDPYINDALSMKQSCAIQLFQTESPIHDRFLIMRNGNTYSGICIGTSFNSLNSNHYCIHTLQHREAKGVLGVLQPWIKNNLAVLEESTYD